MLLAFFKKPLSRVLVGVLLVAALLWLRAFVDSSLSFINFSNYQMPFFHWVDSLIGGNQLVEKIITLTLVIVNGLYLIQLNTRHMLLKQRTHLPALFYILFVSAITPLQSINPALFAAFFTIVAIDNLFLTNKPLDNLFKAGFFVSVASLFYLPASVILLLLFFAIIILNHGGVKPWFAVLFGFLTPIAFVVFYFYFFGNDLNALPKIIELSTSPLKHNLLYTGTIHVIIYVVFLLLLAVAALFLISSMSAQKIIVRKHNVILLWFMVMIFLVAIVFSFCSSEVFYLLSIPMAFIFSNYFTLMKSRFWGEFLFMIILGIVVALQILSA